MSEPRLISPMLDGCIIGEAMSSHNGVRCCPALREATGEKYIVKIISIPASQVQLEALLLTGAVENNESALQYFMEQAQDILKDRDTLAAMSRLEGFSPYLDAQIVPMEDGVGYEVYLLSPYRRSAEKLLSSNTLTHLGVMNLGLDLCAALAACRRAGFLYADLKPSNIFYSEEQGYRISDLGFVNLNSLHYMSLPEKFNSPYIPAEVADPMAVLNDTMDVYALGLVLYQAYNGGVLPAGLGTPGYYPEPPLYADYEMSEIILKACAPEARDRWADPTQMGQALVSYMQRNTVNDEPVIPPAVPDTEPEAEEEPIEEFLPDTDPAPEELAFLQELTSDETAPSEENTEHLEDAPMTEETSQMLAQADDLINHELPEPVVAPEPIEIPMPEPIVVEEEVSEEAAEAAAPEAEEAEEAQEPQEEAQEPEAPVKSLRSRPRKKRSCKVLLILLLVLSLTAATALGGWYYYRNIYQQHIESLIVNGTENMLSVQVNSRIDEDLLTVYCTDSYGNSYSSPVTAGIAIFEKLAPQTRYTVRVEIDGFHALTGMSTTSFTTATQTNILSFQAAVGPVDGSVLLSFTLEGKDTEEWTVTYSADNVPEKSQTFTGRSVTVSDLVIGANYTFTLSSAEELYMIGQTQVSFLARKLLFAQDLAILACGGGSLTASWNAPDGETVESWTVRCYNESGYNETFTTTETSYTFTGLDHSVPCTVEVFAEGMNQSQFVQIQANPVTVNAFHFDGSDQKQLNISWDFLGTAPEGGWIVHVTVDGTALPQQTVAANSATTIYVPEAKYEIRIVPANGVPCFNTDTTYETPEAETFAGFDLTAADLTVRLCLRPDQETWDYNNVAESAYKTSFKADERAAVTILSVNRRQKVDETVMVTLVLRKSDGTLVQTEVSDIGWLDIWSSSRKGKLDLPALPQELGDYTLSIYFNGQIVTVQNFSIV